MTVIVDIPTAIAQIVTHCTAAGAALSVPITDIARADPLPSGRCGRVWWGGEIAPPGMPGNRVLNGELVGHIVNITFFWPVADQGTTVTASRDSEVEALAKDIRTRLQGDSQLGDTVYDLDVNYAVTQFALYAGTVFRTLEIDVHLSYDEYPRNP